MVVILKSNDQIFKSSTCPVVYPGEGGGGVEGAATPTIEKLEIPENMQSKSLVSQSTFSNFSGVEKINHGHLSSNFNLDKD